METENDTARLTMTMTMKMSKDTSTKASLSLINGQLNHHFAQISSEINQNEPSADLPDCVIDDQIDVLAKIRSSELLSAENIKSHMMQKFHQMCKEKKQFLQCNGLQTPTPEVINFVHSQLSQVGKELNNDILQLHTGLRQSINQRLDQFCKISASESVIDKKNILSYTKITEYWPFVKELIETYHEPSGSNISYYPIEFTAVTSVPFDLDILSNLVSVGQNRYHVVIQVSSRNQIIICHFPGTGYIAQVFIDQVSVAIGEYDLNSKKSGSYFHYADGQLKLVNQYQSGVLEGTSIYLINTQVGLVVPFQTGQIHGMMQAIDSVGKAVYHELFWQNQSLVPIFA
jgi:hypothetical protein